jgi:phospholipase/carboxylesterase
MPAWYDITGLGRGGANLEHVAVTRLQVTDLLEREAERDVASERVVLAGFSQGAGIALYTGLRHPRTLGGILVASGYELLPETLGSEAAPANLRTPILFCHGLYDDLVPAALGREAFAARVAEGRPAEWREFLWSLALGLGSSAITREAAGAASRENPIGHEVSMPEIETIGAWLREQLPRE